MFLRAPRLHGGLKPGEFPAILEKGEEVRSKNRSRRGDGAINVYQTWNIQTPDIGSFKASQGQLMVQARRALNRAGRNM
jgi:hypothetical protein